MEKLLVIGSVTSDVLHLVDRTIDSVGGAGMYTAMAACRSGAMVDLFGPRPDPCPELIKPIAERLSGWLGPVISPLQLPKFEISYRSGKTEYLKTSFGAEELLAPHMLPPDLSMYDLVHITPLCDASRQLSFVQACRQRGAKRISAGTGLFIVEQKPQVVRAVMDQSDYFFMNDQEAEGLVGSFETATTEPGKVLFITLGVEGACIIQGDVSSMIPAVSTNEFDPTGAGDTFCGATLANLLRKRHPNMAARFAVALAAEMIEYIGPTALLSNNPPPEVLFGPGVQVNDEQVAKVAEVISTLSELPPFPFVSSELPSVGHPKALDYFFSATLQQFSFWTEKDNHYDQPLIARISGADLKGSDYLWESYRRSLERDSDFYSPKQQANLRREEMLEVFRADNGDDPMPALDLHLEKANHYGRDMLALRFTPEKVIKNAVTSNQPLGIFLETLDKIGGYKEDPLRKKSSLLAMILNQRPEDFFPLRMDEQIAPVIDYHAMRSCLRIGLIDVVDDDLNQKLQNRLLLQPSEEWEVRYASYRAIEKVILLSGKRSGSVDLFFFNARKRCPEMTEPECQYCQLDSVCEHRKELFQPVLRTSFY